MRYAWNSRTPPGPGRLLLAACFLLISGNAVSEQGCPYRYYPGGRPPGPVCIPIPGIRLPQAEEVWSARWGAIAIDSTVRQGGVGTVAGARAEFLALQAALQECRDSGGGVGCEVLLIYKNGCGVIAWGESLATTASGPTLAGASQLALQNCQLETADCEIYYAACSFPERE